jgi:predicted patatin/cPLA2 family phospholipase
MCATRTDLREVAILRSYSSSDDVEDGPPEESDAKESNEVYKKQHPTVKAAIGFEDITIWEAARATSAAPTYFPEMKFKGVTFWDGGLLNNNPIDQLWDARFDAEMQVKCILSLGASRPTRTVLGPFALVNKIKQITGFLTDCEPKHKDFERMIRRMNTRLPDYEQIQYFRLNASTENESIDLSDYRKIGDLERYTNNYLDTFEAQETILRCAWMLAKGHTQNPA